MKTSLYLVVVIAAFALTEGSAAEEYTEAAQGLHGPLRQKRGLFGNLLSGIGGGISDAFGNVGNIIKIAASDLGSLVGKIEAIVDKVLINLDAKLDKLFANYKVDDLTSTKTEIRNEVEKNMKKILEEVKRTAISQEDLNETIKSTVKTIMDQIAPELETTNKNLVQFKTELTDLLTSTMKQGITEATESSTNAASTTSKPV